MVNPITVGNFAVPFSCTLVGETSDSMTTPTLRLIYWWDGRGLLLWLLSGPPGFTCWISFARVFSFIYCWVIIFALSHFLYLDLYVLGDDALISYGSFMQIKHLYFLIHIWTKSEVGALWNRFKPSSKIFYWPFQGGASFVDHLCFFFLVFVMLSCFHWCPGSGMVLHCTFTDLCPLPYLDHFLFKSLNPYILEG